MQYINMSGNLPMGIAYPPRTLAEPRSGRYAGCESAASEVFGCIPHGAGAYRESDSFAMWAVHHGVTVSMTTVSISSFILGITGNGATLASTEAEVTRHGSHTESRMRENCTYGSMRGRAYPITRGVPLYSTHRAVVSQSIRL